MLQNRKYKEYISKPIILDLINERVIRKDSKSKNIPCIYAILEEQGIEIAQYYSQVHLGNSE